jgi:putative flippase GtrA
MESSAVGALWARVSRQQFGRFLLVGALNTLFGYCCYALLTALFQPRIPHGYILAGVLASLINITFSVTGYKLFVFKTKGNYFKEWARSIVVYSGGILSSLILLPIFVFIIRRCTPFSASAPYIGGAILTATNAIYYFFAHRGFTFKGNITNSKSAV